MKANSRNPVRVFVPLVLMLGVISLIWPSHGTLEREQADEHFPTRGRAKNVPISHIQIKLKFTVDGQHTIYATQFEGSLIRIEKEGTSIYGFAPYIIDQEALAIAIRVYEISRIKKEEKVVGESIKELQTLEAGKATDHYLTTYADRYSHFTIEIVDVKKDSELKGKSISPQSGEDDCCVECNGMTTCSCQVSTACGGCCHPVCCSLAY